MEASRETTDKPRLTAFRTRTVTRLCSSCRLGLVAKVSTSLQQTRCVGLLGTFRFPCRVFVCSCVRVFLRSSLPCIGQ